MHHYYLLHKPFNYLSQFVNNQTKRKNQLLLGALGEFPEGTMSVGRLDKDSEGLLLLTTDGKFSAAVTSKKVEKEYYVQLDGIPTSEALEQLRTGVEITVNGQPYTTLPAGVRVLSESPGFLPRSRPVRDDRHGPTSWVSITIREGKFRQVRKMTAAVGLPTLRLVRVRVGEWRLDGLSNGEWRAFFPPNSELGSDKNLTGGPKAV